MQRVSLHREHLQAAKIIVKKLIMRDKVFFLIVHAKKILGSFISKIFVYTLLQGTSIGAVVMAEIKIVMDCVLRGVLYIRSWYSLGEKTLIVSWFVDNAFLRRKSHAPDTARQSCAELTVLLKITFSCARQSSAELTELLKIAFSCARSIGFIASHCQIIQSGCTDC